MASHKSVVKVAIPHCRGRWFPTTAIRIGRVRRGGTQRNGADFVSNSLGRVSCHVMALGCEFNGRLGVDIAGSLMCGPVEIASDARRRRSGVRKATSLMPGLVLLFVDPQATVCPAGYSGPAPSPLRPLTRLAEVKSWLIVVPRIATNIVYRGFLVSDSKSELRDLGSDPIHHEPSTSSVQSACVWFRSLSFSSDWMLLFLLPVIAQLLNQAHR
jgi:hypothetical protein